jgi:hypothetical protein
VLPATYAGSPRDMQIKFQNAMAIVRDRGAPSLCVWSFVDRYRYYYSVHIRICVN